MRYSSHSPYGSSSVASIFLVLLGAASTASADWTLGLLWLVGNLTLVTSSCNGSVDRNGGTPSCTVTRGFPNVFSPDAVIVVVIAGAVSLSINSSDRSGGTPSRTTTKGLPKAVEMTLGIGGTKSCGSVSDEDVGGVMVVARSFGASFVLRALLAGGGSTTLRP